MDKFWSIFTMPIGVLITFCPAMLAWWLMEGRHRPKKKARKPDSAPLPSLHSGAR